jgi:biopolymer transport protein ExbB
MSGTNEQGTSLTRRLLKSGFLAATALLLSGCGKDETWWSEEWTLRREVTLDTAPAGAAEPLTGARVLLRLSDANYTFGAAKDDGTDIRLIAADNKTELPFFIESYNALMNEAHVWVKPDDLKAGKSAFTLYYGNTGPKAVKADDSKTTFDADTVLSWSFSDKGTAPGDGTSNGNNGNETFAQVETGLAGGAANVTPTTVFSIPQSPTLEWIAGGAMTWSAWIKPAGAGGSGSLFARDNGVSGVVIAVENGSLVLTARTNGTAIKSEPGAPLTPGAWQHVALAASGGQMALYLNGELYKSIAAALPALNIPIFIGAAQPAPAFVCEMDEMQISKSARTPGWIKFAAINQGSSDAAAKVVSFGPEQQGSTGFFAPGSTTAILLSSLTVDGWIVIAILAVMGVISWWIMYSKVKYMNGIAKGNRAFMNVWKHVSRDLTVLDDMEGDTIKSLGGKISPEGQRAMRQSSVYRIYHTGSEEIRHRKEADGKEFVDRGLSGRTIQAIKASMDGAMVRESQKLSRLIVLLTICISGGPFLGLLGTVVGVMITFAAIAAAGDVNVNAIAPGIAAALVATVAGLAVAIPALFGYNYIQSRVKDANTDMHVFIDEFVTRMAEFYPDRRG